MHLLKVPTLPLAIPGHMPTYRQLYLSHYWLHTTLTKLSFDSKAKTDLLRLKWEKGRDFNFPTRCQRAKYFALLADETTDKSTVTQLCECVCYIDIKPEGAEVVEQFLGFVHAKSLKGVEICNLLVTFLQDRVIDIGKMRAQGYDGVSNMSGRHNGVQALMKQHAPDATYIHCKAHCLNLAVVHSCKEPCVRTMMATVQEIGFAFHYSAKRMEAFLDELSGNLEVQVNQERKIKLVKLFETRWTARADALTTFKNALPVVVDALEFLRGQNNDKAGIHLNSMLRFDFLIGLYLCEHILKTVVHLSIFLQSVSCDMWSAMEECRVVVATLRAERNNDIVLAGISDETTRISRLYGIEPSIPRRVGRQQNRNNVPAANPSEYWRRSLYYIFIDHIIMEIEDRLLGEESRFRALQLLPAKTGELDDPALVAIHQSFQSDVPNDTADFRSEVDRWKTRWRIAEDKPQTLVDTFNRTSPNLYPSIHNTLLILLTMPVSTATAKRSFSVLRRIKTYLRSATRQDRLSSLAVLHVHRETHVNI
ncbi:zinc finger MYM-type protein 1-like [Mizuhopecten yessoensis]|uniref:zinc finger MYM-type protein 1-like n=1 Tax=Mizuhopecten yessoensis TaxID=6573 RepID=UPI000B45C253|nr:zinc finger MYM-type protein 1-like [Mizuhopecten yessoensis]